MILLNGEVGNYIYSNGKKFSYFAGNNYLGLAGHPEIKKAVIRAVEKYGVNFAASRHTTGTSDLHLELEGALASFKGKEDAVVFASGYQGNSILLEILKGSYSTIFIDQSAHASIIAAIPADVVKVMYYDHCDAGHLDYLLDYNRGSSPLVITDGIFALTGEIAPLNQIYEVVRKHDAILVVDDAHATGVIGATGKGTPEHFGLPGDGKIYQTETMSKALGGLRKELLDKAWTIREALTAMDFRTTHFRTPIVPVLFDTAEKANGLSQFLEENRVIAPSVNYPARQQLFLVRIAVSATHTDDQISQLLGLLKQWKDKNESN